MGGGRSTLSNSQLESLHETVQQTNNGAVPQNFTRTALGHDSSRPITKGKMPRSSPRNPQTEQFLDMLGLPYSLDQQPPQTPAVTAQGVHLVSGLLYCASFGCLICPNMYGQACPACMLSAVLCCMNEQEADVVRCTEASAHDGFECQPA